MHEIIRRDKKIIFMVEGLQSHKNIFSIFITKVEKYVNNEEAKSSGNFFLYCQI